MVGRKRLEPQFQWFSIAVSSLAEHVGSSAKGSSTLAIRADLYVLVSHSGLFSHETEREVIVLVDMAHSAWFTSEVRTIFTDPGMLLWACVLRHLRPAVRHGSSSGTPHGRCDDPFGMTSSYTRPCSRLSRSGGSS